MLQETLFCTIDVADLYTMVPQVERVLSLKKMFDYFKLKHVGGLKVETIMRLSRYVMQKIIISLIMANIIIKLKEEQWVLLLH